MNKLLIYALGADFAAVLLLIVANADFFSSFDFEAIGGFALVLIVAVCFWGGFLMQSQIPVVARVMLGILLIPAHILTALFTLMMLGHPVRGI